MTLANTTDLQLDFGAVLLRAQKLGSDCAPLTTGNVRMITAGIVSMTATPVLQEGASYQFVTGLGDQIAEVARPDRIRRYDIQGQLVTVDREFLALLFGGASIVGDVGDFAGDTIGWASPGLDSPDNDGVYLEVFSQIAYEGAGDCSGSAVGPAYTGHIFPRVRLTPGEISIQNQARVVSFTGRAVVNPTPSLDPFGDFPGTGSVPSDSPYITVDYASLPGGAQPGHITLP